MWPPGTITWPSDMTVRPAQNSQVGEGTSVKALVEGFQTCGCSTRLQARTLPSFISTTWMGTSGQGCTGPHLPGPVEAWPPGVTVMVAVSWSLGTTCALATTWYVPG